MPRRLSALVAATALVAGAALGASTAAQAQDQESGEVVLDRPARREVRVEPSRRSHARPGPLRFFGGFSLAVGGDLQVEDVDGPDLDATVGLQGGVDYIVMDYFAIGGEMRFLFPKIDGGDRNFLWDIVVKPRGRYEFGNLPLEVYGTMPIGLTVAGIDGPIEGTPGFTLGILGGATWFFNENIGVNAEMGWMFHKFGAEEKFRGRTIAEADYKMNQFLLICPNFVYAL